MRVLGIDSSGIVASVAIVEDEELLAEYTVNYKKTHSQTLLPMLDEIVKMLEFDMETIDAIAVAGGPGSFTGLRIGSATAKGLGLALNKELIHVPTVDALAYNLVGHDGLVCPIMDARREQTYTGIYSFEGKYIKRKDDGSSPTQSAKGGGRVALNGELRDKIRAYTRTVYKRMNLRGAVRMDFLVSEGQVYLCEVNTVPGSLAYYLFCERIMDARAFFSDLLEEAVLSHKESQKQLVMTGILRSVSWQTK